MIIKKLMKVLSGVVLAVVLVSNVTAQTPTRLQVIFTPDRTKAEAVASHLNNSDFGPAEVLATGDGFKVRTKIYNSYAEAAFAKPSVRAIGYQDAYPVSEPSSQSAEAPFNTTSLLLTEKSLKQMSFGFQVARPSIERPELTDELKFLDNGTAPADQLLQKAKAFRYRSQANDAIAAFDAFVQRFPARPEVSEARMKKAYWLAEVGNREEAAKEFEQIASDYSTAPLAGEANMRMAYLALANGGNDTGALKMFLKVASGEIPSTSEARIESMIRCAALYHRAHDLATAASAYDTIAKSTSNQEIQAFAKMQKAGIILELARNDKATYERVRETCLDVLDNYPDANRQTRSTAALMHLESYCYEHDFETAYSLKEKYSEEFEGTPEAPIGYYWLAYVLHENGKSKEALEIVHNLLKGDFDTSGRFPYTNLRAALSRLEEKILNTP